MPSKEKPYVLIVAEAIYLKVCEIKKKNPELSNINAIENFIGSTTYNEISSGKFHDELINRVSKKKISEETLKLLHIQKDLSVKQLIQFPELYYAKSHYPLEISQRAFDHLWRMCESYELWCKESKQKHLIYLKIID
ncbi:hypothetical protein OAY91_00170 [Candidatus Pelagibacter sp.]|nr:hypothetical protein [Candidatus Pelagibacter sp.]|tara:strand:- start:160 stop:570 length:411 start_codon:yes stop_codon:yes gene_type:complete